MDPNGLGKWRKHGGKMAKSKVDDSFDLNALGLQLLLQPNEKEKQQAEEVMAEFDWFQIDESLFD